ncbi:peptidase M16 [Aliarcobacter trophiarum LMG 25534]|uniref:Peptidase M16 n=1 Tax=Aliarcobacter trophiarum LMG 25534 TaxID=1032241 RepID=A0AAD0VLW9_9BACT|nr:pitrilysin family protein [Aliarcobacter trophiarum]AXK48753.1 peptidase, M16 family [Aliarcobacter trophiarum LMG 25534]RXJ92076.1 peptidase M16 [Aliarcobacter trophiarum LMG 25534]
MSANIKHININNINIPVIFEEQKSLPILNLQLIFKNSGYIKDKNSLGLASLSSRVLNEGTKELGSVKFSEILDNNAITIHSSIGFETLTIELSSLKEKSTLAISSLNQLLKSPNLSKDTLEKVKTLAIGNLKRKENDFDDVASKGLNTLLYSGTALANPSSGTIESIKKIELKNIDDFLKSSLVLNNLTIVAGGDISFNELENALKPILKELKNGVIEESKRIEFVSKKEEKELLKETEQAYIYFGSNFNVKIDDENNYKAKVASFILGGSGFGSRLMEEIRVKRGLAYSAYASIGINRLYSNFSGYLQTKNESASQAKELVSSIVEEFVKNGATQDELNAAKSFLVGSEPLRTETLAQRLNRAFMLYFKGLSQDFPQKELELIQSLSLEDLNNYIKTHTELNNLTFFIVRK